jgi:hypothetical protein
VRKAIYHCLTLAVAFGAASCNGTETPVTGSGGAPASGGAAQGGTALASGGATLVTGGTGTNSGGTAVASGGRASGGASTGGTATGGKATGGTATGGTATGGTATGGTTPAGQGPCDIFAAANTPCAAAHSTIRALFASYSGKLYQIRNSSGVTKDINALSAGGFADSASQESHCGTGTCQLLYIYDQTGHGIDLTWQGTDSPVGGISGHTPANAKAESLNVSGHKVYSAYINASQAYWVDGSAKGMPKGNSPQGIYMVTSGKHYNGLCCFDYGNGETTRAVGGGGSMDALYFGTSCWFGGCSGTGPYVEYDPEGGIYPGPTSSWPSTQKSFTSTYVTAMLKNNGSTMMLKGADATTGSLTTVASGKPTSTPNKQGALVLGSGGDCCYSNNNQSQGTFYEGAIVAGYPSDATDNSVQVNVVAAKYGQ